MNDFLKFFFSLSVSGSAIALILFLLKPLLKNKFSKTWQYYIWFIVIARFLLPFTIKIEVLETLFTQTENYLIMAEKNTPEKITIQNNELAGNLMQNQFIPALTEEITNKPQFLHYWNELKNYIWLLWLGIAVALFVRKITGYYDFIKFIKAGRNEIKDTTILTIYDKACTTLKIKKPPFLYVNKMATAPMLVGVIRQFIVLPGLELSNDEIYNIFIHELTHYKRLDIFYKWLVQIAVCFHWYNPLIYFISLEINKSCELSCDEAIIKKLNAEGKKQYGSTLITALKLNGNYGNTIVSITLNEDARLLKERLGAIMKFKKKSKLTIFLSLFLTMAIFCGALTTGVYAATNNQTNIMANKNIELVNSEFIMENGGLKCRLDFQNKTEIEITLFYFNFEGYNASGEIIASSVNNTNNLGKIITPNQIESIYLNLPQNLQTLRLGIVKYDTNLGYSVSIHDNQVVWKWLISPSKTVENDTTVSNLPEIELVDYRFYFINGITPAITPTFKNNTTHEIKNIEVEVKFIEFGDSSYTYNTGVSAKPGEVFIPASWGLATDVKQIKLGVISYKASNDTYYQIAKDKIEWHNITVNNKLIYEESGGVNPDTNSQQIDSDALNEVDKAAIELFQYSGSWDIAELLIPNMSKKGIDSLVEMYNQKNRYSNPKKADDYYNVTGAGADERALTMIQKNGMWKYAAPLFPFMSNEGIEKVVDVYNQKNSNKKIAAEYFNAVANDEKSILTITNKNAYNIAESGSFKANNNQVLFLDIISSVKGGTVDLFLFDPNGKEHRISIGSSDFTKEINLSEGIWQYNCSGFFKDGGNIKIVGTIK